MPLFGKKQKDIELPNQSGRVDPRLKQPNVMERLRKAGEGYKILEKKGIAKKSSAIDALRSLMDKD